MKKLFLTLLLASAAVAHAAPAPTLIPFQGRLTDQTGVGYTNGQFTLIFNLYDQAVGGNVLWTETHQKVGVVNGMVNVFLGSINPALASVDFSQTRHLGITIDADNNPNTPDPEMVPRQMIIPAFWSQNASKMSGYDWTPLFGVNNPSGTIPGSKLQAGSVNGDRLQSATITSTALAAGSVTSAALAAGSVNSAALAAGSVGLTNIYLRTTNNPATRGNIAVGPHVSYTTGPNGGVTTPTDVPGLTATLTTTGRPVQVTLIPSGVGVAGIACACRSFADTVHFQIQGFRNGTNLVYHTRLTLASTVDFSNITVPPGAVSFVDFNPGVGTNTYSFKAWITNPSQYGEFFGVRVMAFEF